MCDPGQITHLFGLQVLVCQMRGKCHYLHIPFLTAGYDCKSFLKSPPRLSCYKNSPFAWDCLQKIRRKHVLKRILIKAFLFPFSFFQCPLSVGIRNTYLNLRGQT